MVRGHKGFDRVVWAFKHVLNNRLAWLFYNLKQSTDGSGPLALHQPKIVKVEPEADEMEAARMAEISLEWEEYQYDEANQLLEWLTLIFAGSPRVQQHDRIDPYLSRYSVPSACKQSSEATENEVQDLVKIRWHGFIPPQFIKKVLLATMKASGTDWFAFKAASLDGKAYAFIHKDHHTLTWEYAD